MSANQAKQTLAELSLLSIDQQVDMQSLFTTFIPKLGDELRRGWQSLMNYSGKEKIISDEKRFIELITKENYMDISAFQFACPEGMITDYLTYTTLLKEASLFSIQTADEVVSKLKQHIGRLINGNLVTYSPSGIEKSITDRIKQREKIEQEIKKCISTRTHRRIDYSTAINRNSDWAKVFENVKYIQQLDDDKRKKLSKDLEQILEMLDTLIEKVSSDENKNVNKQAVKYTSELVYAVGQEVKFVAQVYYLIESLTQRLSDGVDNTIKVFSKK